MVLVDRLSVKAKYPFLPEAKRAFLSLGFPDILPIYILIIHISGLTYSL
jgi:hypothetical protein